MVRTQVVQSSLRPTNNTVIRAQILSQNSFCLVIRPITFLYKIPKQFFGRVFDKDKPSVFALC
jgi:hypothetical protein